MVSDQALTQLGVFRAGGVCLAVSIDQLREVVPLVRLLPALSLNPAVVGLIDLRGRQIPVLSLEKLAPTPGRRESVGDVGANVGANGGASAGVNVVILRAGPRHLGVLADEIVGVADLESEQIQLTPCSGQGHLLVTDTFHWSASCPTVSLLNTDYLFSLDHLAYPEYSDQPGASVLVGPQDDEFAQVLLMCVSGIYLALSSAHVLTTVPQLEIRRGTLSNGYCLGSIEYRGVNVPVVDLLKFSGITHTPASGAKQGFIVRFEAGLVAFSVDAILDVVTANLGLANRMPGGFSGNPLIEGILPATALMNIGRAAELSAECFILLSAEALSESPALGGLSSVNTPVKETDSAYQDQRSLVSYEEQTTVLTYRVGAEVATPIHDVKEIVSWRDDMALRAGGDLHRSYFIHKGHAIPIFDLGDVLAGQALGSEAGSCVLLVDAPQACVGFRVSALTSIDTGPALRLSRELRTALERLDHHQCYRDAWPLVPIGLGEKPRMLSLVSLRALAERIC